MDGTMQVTQWSCDNISLLITIMLWYVTCTITTTSQKIIWDYFPPLASCLHICETEKENTHIKARSRNSLFIPNYIFIRGVTKQHNHDLTWDIAEKYDCDHNITYGGLFLNIYTYFKIINSD